MGGPAMSGAPRVSVVIPAYNRAATIEACIRSVLDQTTAPFEVVLVDDGSTDETRAVATSVGDHRVRIVEAGPNRGAQAARNTGIRESNGNWIAFLDSDDTWAPQKLERQLDVLKGAGYDPTTVVHSDVFRYYPVSGRREHWHLPRIDGMDAYRSLLRNPSPMLQSMLVSRAALEHIGLLDEGVPSYQEWDTSIRLAQAGGRFIHIQEPLLDYHIGREDAISSDGRRGIVGYRYVIDKFRSQIMSELGMDGWRAHLEVQLRSALSQSLWDVAANYLDELKGERLKNAWVLRLCTYLHIRPATLSAARRYLLTGAPSRKHAPRGAA
jgi:glycosyltransferase involved in cell wall biosynthesis